MFSAMAASGVPFDSGGKENLHLKEAICDAYQGMDGMNY